MTSSHATAVGEYFDVRAHLYDHPKDFDAPGAALAGR